MQGRVGGPITTAVDVPGGQILAEDHRWRDGTTIAIYCQCSDVSESF